MYIYLDPLCEMLAIMLELGDFHFHKAEACYLAVTVLFKLFQNPSNQHLCLFDGYIHGSSFSNGRVFQCW